MTQHSLYRVYLSDALTASCHGPPEGCGKYLGCEQENNVQEMINSLFILEIYTWISKLLVFTSNPASSLYSSNALELILVYR